MFNFPLSKYKISGSSMVPAFFDGDKVLVFHWIYLFRKPSVGEIVVAKINNIPVVKRIQKIKQNEYFLIGDNLKESTDSRVYGFVEKKDILGKVIKKI